MALSILSPDSLDLTQDFAGIRLGGTGSANELDDYEYGTFTPAYMQGITSPVYNAQKGGYVKIGDVVHFQIDIRLTSGTGNGSRVQISGLPFNSTSNTDYAYGGAFMNYNGNYRDDGNISWHVGANVSYVEAYLRSGGNFTGTNISTITATLLLTGSYVVA